MSVHVATWLLYQLIWALASYNTSIYSYCNLTHAVQFQVISLLHFFILTTFPAVFAYLELAHQVVYSLNRISGMLPPSNVNKVGYMLKKV